MASLKIRAGPSAALSTITIVAIAANVGGILLCLIITTVILLLRARRIHKKLLADLEERGVLTAQAHEEARGSVSRPRAVLRRNTILPFNAKSGWGALPSTETLTSAEEMSVVAHYAPSRPMEGKRRSSRLSWPFSMKRLSGHSVHMKQMKAPRLSTVLEDPKPSTTVPLLADRLSINVLKGGEDQSSSSQTMLHYHPAFRHSINESVMAEQESRINGGPFFRDAANKRLQRARSIAAVPSAPTARPQLRARAASLCSQTPGIAPDLILPPLPLDIARIKSEVKRRSQLRQMPSKLSVSSFDSADTSILTSRPSPIVPHTSKVRAEKVTKPGRKSPGGVGAKQFRDTLDLRTQVLGSQHLSISSTIRSSMVIEEAHNTDNESQDDRSKYSNSRPLSSVSRAHTVSPSKVPSPTANPLATQNMITPKRKSKTYVSSAGSPERYCHSEAKPRSLAGVIRSPKHQHSQTSSRSSGGNPFQWDPTPFAATGKPSALKGSPSARQGHRRKNSVRISLVPIIHGPPSRTPPPSLLNEKKDDTSEGASADRDEHGLGLGCTSTRSPPTPPSSATFAPELKFAATSLRASLTPMSPILPLVSYDQSHVVFPKDHVLPELSAQEQKRLSNGSIFSLSRFPETPNIIEPYEADTLNALTYLSARHYDFSETFKLPDTPLLAQYPFRPQTPDRNRSPSPSSLIDLDEYDPERPSLVFQTPANTSSRAWQSGFAAIPEESSVTSSKTIGVDSSCYDDSPPVSPKTVSPPRFVLDSRSTYNLPVYATAIPEEPSEIIDPAILSKHAFNLLTSGIGNANGSIIKTSHGNRSSLALVIPPTPASAQSVFEPLLTAAFPSSPPIGNESPVLGRIHSESQASSICSSPALSLSSSFSPTTSLLNLPSPAIPSSPRPSHAQLPVPGLSINFAKVPKLSPSPRGPRGSPPRPLRSSIAALRRMNSDAADAKKEKAGRGERRYLRLGREDSVQLPGDESWLDDIEDDDQTIELDEEEGRRLVGDVLDDYDEGCTELDVDESFGNLSLSTIKPNKDTDTTMATEQETASADSKRSSSIWEDGEKFWSSNTPPQPSPGSPNKLKICYQPLASSPLATLPINRTSSPTRKREFEVAKDAATSPTENTVSAHDIKKRREESVDSRRSSNRYRKRSVLGVGTPNVRIQVTSPSGQVIVGTPGLYDAQGFLRG
jgi:hypothetical protein